MVDLSARDAAPTKKQRAFHMTDATHERLRRGAEASNATMSQVLDRLIWEDLKLPGEAAEARVAARTPPPPGEPLDPETQARLDKSAARLKKAGHYATKIDGSDQRERDSDKDFDL